MVVLLFIAGLVFMIVGAESLVRGASRLAGAVGVSPLVIGLTVVAFGTSAPELAVSVKSALTDQASIAVGNVVGSNIFNVLFILGLSALIVPLIVSEQLIRIDVPLMIALSVMVFLLSLDGAFTRMEGMFMLLCLFSYVGFLILYSRRQARSVKVDADIKAEESAPPVNWLKSVAFVGIGLVLLVVGAGWFVDSAVVFAQILGVSEMVIGLTIVAAGTSMPELVTSIVAALKGERDIAIGNVIGSNIFNLMGVLGVASVLAPGGIEIPASIIRFDIPVMLAVAFACLPIFFSQGGINRKEGALLLAYYVAYTLYLVLVATKHDALTEFSAVMLYFVLPLTAITLAGIGVREMRRRRTHSS